MAAIFDPPTRRLLDNADLLLKVSSDLQEQAARLSRQLGEILRRQAPRPLNEASVFLPK